MNTRRFAILMVALLVVLAGLWAVDQSVAEPGKPHPERPTRKPTKTKKLHPNPSDTPTSTITPTLTLTPTNTLEPTDTTIPLTATDTPLSPTATDTPPAPTDTSTPVPPTDTPAPPTPTFTPVSGDVFYVSPSGSDSGGNGSRSNPWRTVGYALSHGPSGGGFTVLMMDGQYPAIHNSPEFASPVTVQAEHDYRAIIVNEGSTPIQFGGGSYNLTISGLEIRGGSGSQAYALVYLYRVSNLTIDNCIIHDSYNNDLMRVLHSPGPVTVQNSLFYNPELPEEHIDINGGSQNVTVRGNVFFNDYAGTTSRPLILVKTSNLTEDGITRHITIDGNVFLGRDSGANQPDLNVGGDDKTWYTAQDVTVQNNLFVALDGSNVGYPVQLTGSRDVTIRANTMRGPWAAFGKAVGGGSRPVCENVQYTNNIFLDDDPERFLDGDSGEIAGSGLANNLYWQAPPVTSGDALNYTDDARRIVADPLLSGGMGYTPPTWDGQRFAGGYAHIQDVREAFVTAWAVPGAGSPAIDAASADMPGHDILGHARTGAGDVGAVEVSFR